MQTIVKTAAASDFLALVPTLVGFQPRNSVVLVAFRGNRTCGAMRFDLPASEDSAVHKRIATTSMGMLCRIPAVDAVVPVLYTDESFAAASGIPHRALARVLRDRAEYSGFLVRDELCVAGDGWGSYLDDNRPADGHPLAEIAASDVPQRIPAKARGELADPQTRAEPPRVDLAIRERVAREYNRYRSSFEDPNPGDDDLPDTDPVQFAEAALASGPECLSATDLALILFMAQLPAIRDEMMLRFAFGSDADITAGGELMLGTQSERPDAERIDRAITLLSTITAAAPRSARPAPLCMLAWLSWALGMGSVAGIHIDRALEIDPSHSMAVLLNTLLASGQLPEWAFNQPVAPGVK